MLTVLMFAVGGLWVVLMIVFGVMVFKCSRHMTFEQTQDFISRVSNDSLRIR